MTYIGITDSETAYPNYPLWIKGQDASIEIIRLTADNAEALARCSAVVLSGGVDTHPKFYNNPRMDYPNAPDRLDAARDAFEMQVFEWSQERALPLLAICRGMQLVNVCLGGTLIQDLEEHHKANHRKQNGRDGVHELLIEKGSFLHALGQSELDRVNSAHHQGLDQVAGALRVTAWSKDGVPEAIERKATYHQPFLLGVQWHPERLGLQHPEHVFTQNIRQQFVEAARAMKHKRP